MFTKKNSLPPRPHMPNHEHMLEDLDRAGVDDVAFKITSKYLQYLYWIRYVKNVYNAHFKVS